MVCERWLVGKLLNPQYSVGGFYFKFIFMSKEDKELSIKQIESIVFEKVGNLTYMLQHQKNLLPEQNIYGFIRINNELYKKVYL